MIPHIQTLDDYWRLRRQAHHWQDVLKFALAKAGISQAASEFVLMPNTSFPVFASQHHVVKLVGFLPESERVFTAERAALCGLHGSNITPPLLASFAFEGKGAARWLCLVTQRLAGQPLDPKAGLHALPADLPEQLAPMITQFRAAKIADLGALSVPTPLSLMQAAAQTRLGTLQIAQVQMLLDEIDPLESTTLCNADIWQPHLLMEGTTLTGIVDWGDAVVANRHFEYVQIFLNLFALNKGLMNRLLMALNDRTNWCPRRMMLLALIRQSSMHDQHGAGDVFYQVPRETITQCNGDVFQLAEAIFAF